MQQAESTNSTNNSRKANVLLFARELRSIRIALRFTQESFALALKIPLSTYKGWEYAKQLPCAENMRTLVEYVENKDIYMGKLEQLYCEAKLL
jgi:DNA-binding transcriptional regulator YiaG